MRFFSFITLLLTMLLCSSCYTDSSDDFFKEVNLPQKSEPLDQGDPVIVLFASDFPVYPQSYTYLGTIRMNQVGWRICKVDPLVFLRIRASRVGANVVYIKHVNGLYDAEDGAPLCDNLLADFLKVENSIVDQYYMSKKADAFNGVESGALKW